MILAIIAIVTILSLPISIGVFQYITIKNNINRQDFIRSIDPNSDMLEKDSTIKSQIKYSISTTLLLFIFNIGNSISILNSNNIIELSDDVRLIIGIIWIFIGFAWLTILTVPIIIKQNEIINKSIDLFRMKYRFILIDIGVITIGLIAITLLAFSFGIFG